jgi:hypothetical protein
MYETVTKYPKSPWKIPNGHKIFKHFPIWDPPKVTQIGILGLKTNHLATLHWSNFRPIWSPCLRRCVPQLCCQVYPNAPFCHGCQVVYFHTKNPNLGIFWRGLDWKMLVYFTTLWNILLGLFYGRYSLWSFAIFFLFWYVWTNKNLATLHLKFIYAQTKSERWKRPQEPEDNVVKSLTSERIYEVSMGLNFIVKKTFGSTTIN